MTQMTLDIERLVQPEMTGLTIQQRFEAFHAANPWVLRALERLTEDYLAAGQTRIGIRMLWEVIRWQYNRATSDPSSGFKVNDHYHSRYVRLLIELHPEWTDVFHLRELRAS